MTSVCHPTAADSLVSSIVILSVPFRLLFEHFLRGMGNYKPLEKARKNINFLPRKMH